LRKLAVIALLLSVVLRRILWEINIP
jgi:hypothetical protein